MKQRKRSDQWLCDVIPFEPCCALFRVAVHPAFSAETQFVPQTPDTLDKGRPNTFTSGQSSEPSFRSNATSLEHTRMFGTDNAAMELTACVGGVAGQSTFSNWSTETTRVFENGYTSRMDLTGDVADNPLASQLRSALNAVAEKTRVFSTEEDTGNMEFTACIPSNLIPVQNEQGKTLTELVPVRFTSTEQGVPSAPASEATLVETEYTQAMDRATKVDSLSFLQKMGIGNSAASLSVLGNQVDSQAQTCISQAHTVDRQPEKISSERFLSHFMGNVAVHENSGDTSAQMPVKPGDFTELDETSRKRTITESSEEMEFTACVNPTVSDAVRPAPVETTNKSGSISQDENTEPTTGFIQLNPENIERTDDQDPTANDGTQLCGSEEGNIIVTLDDRKGDVVPSAQVGLEPETDTAGDHGTVSADKTRIFDAEEENMEFTSCITQSVRLCSAVASTLAEKEAKLSEGTSISNDFHENDAHMDLTTPQAQNLEPGESEMGSQNTENQTSFVDGEGGQLKVTPCVRAPPGRVAFTMFSEDAKTSVHQELTTDFETVGHKIGDANEAESPGVDGPKSCERSTDNSVAPANTHNEHIPICIDVGKPLAQAKFKCSPTNVRTASVAFLESLNTKPDSHRERALELDSKQAQDAEVSSVAQQRGQLKECHDSQGTDEQQNSVEHVNDTSEATDKKTTEAPSVALKDEVCRTESRKRSFPDTSNEATDGDLETKNPDSTTTNGDGGTVCPVAEQTAAKFQRLSSPIEPEHPVKLILEEEEPALPGSPELTSLGRLKMRLGKVRKSLDPCHTTVFNPESTFSQLDLTNCTGNVGLVCGISQQCAEEKPVYKVSIFTAVEAHIFRVC